MGSNGETKCGKLRNDDAPVVATQGAECVTTAPTPSGSQGWKKVRLGEYVYCIRGVSYNGDRDLWTEESDNTIRLLRSNNIQDALFVDSGVQFVSKYCATSEQILRQNDIMICMANGSKDLVGKTCIFKVPFAVPYTFGAFMGCLRAKDSTGCMDYLFQLMNSSAYWKNIKLMLSGSSINNLRPTDIERMEFAMPDVAEQRRIAAALGDMDKLIDNLSKRIEKKKAIKQGAMQELLTGKKRLPGFEGEWEKVELGTVFNIEMGQSPSSEFYNMKRDGLPLIQGNADLENHNSVIRMYTSQITKVCDKGDVILSVRAPVGAVGKASFKSCIGRGVCSIKDETGYLYQYLLFIEGSWSEFSKGSTFDSISSDELRGYKLILPPTLAEQRAIAKVLGDMDAEIARLEDKREKLIGIKKGMMSDLLTGKVRLKSANEA